MPEAESVRATSSDERVRVLEGELAELRGAYARLKHTYTRALEELELMRRRLFVAKAERIDTSADQLAFDKMFDKVAGLKNAVDAINAANGDSPAGPDGKKKRKGKPSGRRDLSKTSLPVERVEVTDEALEGKATRIGVEESQRVMFRRGGRVRVVLARVVYKLIESAPTVGVGFAAPSLLGSSRPVRSATCFSSQEVCVSESKSLGGGRCTTTPTVCAPPARPQESAAFRIVTAPMPKEMFPRGMLAPSMIAHILFEKYGMGVPFYRQEQQSAVEGFPIGRATMCRYAEDAGATLGALVEAARKEALATAFCLSTDATGVAIQPTPIEDGKRTRQPCRKGHFFVTLADRDHVFFDYQAKHTSAAVWEMFKGFSGYVQADAHAIYDALFRGEPPKGVTPDPSPSPASPPPTEVGCWSHARRKFWEAAVCKHPVGLDGLRMINKIFEADRLLSELPPSQRKERREVLVRPLVEAFFLWAKDVQSSTKERGLVATAVGYALRQEAPLRRFLDDGRLRLENNAAERALRTIATGRKNWLFCGSDDHASAAANLFSLLASCKLHGLDQEAYLAEIIMVMPYWPAERYIELTPKYWAGTRARIPADELERPLGPITVPPAKTAEQKSATS